MMRITLGMVSLVLLLSAIPAAADILSLEDAMAPRVMGRDDAPVTIQEFSSLTCPHCAAFHRDTLPRLKAAYIDTGKVRLVYNDFPLDGLALAAAMLARCVKQDKYFSLLEIFFRSQPRWAKSSAPRDQLEKMVRLAGMSEDDFKACLNNRPLLQAIQARASAAGKVHNIESTPTFIIEGKRYPGSLPFKNFQEILDPLLSKKNAG